MLLVSESLLSVILFHLAVLRSSRKHKENKKRWGLLEIWCFTLMFEPGFPAMAVRGVAEMWKCTYIIALHCGGKKETEVWDCSVQYMLHRSKAIALATSAYNDALGLGLMIYYSCKRHYYHHYYLLLLNHRNKRSVIIYMSVHRVEQGPTLKWKTCTSGSLKVYYANSASVDSRFLSQHSMVFRRCLHSNWSWLFAHINVSSPLSLSCTLELICSWWGACSQSHKHPN